VRRHELDILSPETGLFGELSVGCIERCFVDVEPALRELPRATLILPLEGSDLALRVHDHDADVGAERLVFAHGDGNTTSAGERRERTAHESGQLLSALRGFFG
jgi:hypothetical protein